MSHFVLLYRQTTLPAGIVNMSQYKAIFLQVGQNNIDTLPFYENDIQNNTLNK